MLKHATLGAAALMLASTALARAEVDARTIWQDWQDVYARFGGTLSAASEDFADGTLTLEGVTVTSDVGGTEARTVFGTVTLAEQPDGTVRIALPAQVDVTTTATAGELEQNQDMTLTHEGLDIVASEADGVRTYDVAARTVTLAVTQQMSVPEGSDAEPEGEMPPTDVTFTLSDLASTYRSGMGGDADAFTQEGTAATARIAVETRSEDNPLTISQEMRALAMDVSGTYGPMPTEPVTSLFSSGLAYEGSISHSGSTLALDGSNAATEDGVPAQTYAIDGTSEAGRMGVGLGDGQLSYAVTSTGPALTIESSQAPMPIAVSMAEIGTALSLPAGEPGGEAPFDMSVTLRDLVVDDAVWAMFDPTGQLPRDPATLVLALKGTAVMNVDLLGDPEAMAALQGPPGELKSLDLTELTLTVAGAALRGSGALTFPEPTPVPEPVGTIELALDGGFALLDRLVALGVLPAEQAAFIKGMSGAVARTTGEDQLESTIEFTEGGGISANGLPLR